MLHLPVLAEVQFLHYVKGPIGLARSIMNPLGLGLSIGSMGLDYRDSIGLEY